MDFKNYKEVTKEIKVIFGKDAKDTKLKLDVFSKTHSILEIKQKCDTIIFVFYVE